MWSKFQFVKNGQSVSLFSYFLQTVYRKYWFNKWCRWLDSNRGSLESEATALPNFSLLWAVIFVRQRLRGSPGLVVMGDDLYLKGHGFESRHCILDGHLFTLISCKNCIVSLKRLKNEKERRGLAHLKKTLRWCLPYNGEENCFKHCKKKLNQRSFIIIEKEFNI